MSDASRFASAALKSGTPVALERCIRRALNLNKLWAKKTSKTQYSLLALSQQQQSTIHVVTDFVSMPPKKKGRAPPEETGPSTSSDALEPPVDRQATSAESDTARTSSASDSWTDEQETSLFKAMIRWKPVGSFSRCVEIENCRMATDRNYRINELC